MSLRLKEHCRLESATSIQGLSSLEVDICCLECFRSCNFPFSNIFFVCLLFCFINILVQSKRARSRLGQCYFRLNILIAFDVDRVLTISSMDYLVQEGTGKLRKVNSLLSSTKMSLCLSCLSDGGCLGMFINLYLPS